MAHFCLGQREPHPRQNNARRHLGRRTLNFEPSFTSAMDSFNIRYIWISIAVPEVQLCRKCYFGTPQEDYCFWKLQRESLNDIVWIRNNTPERTYMSSFWDSWWLLHIIHYSSVPKLPSSTKIRTWGAHKLFRRGAFGSTNTVSFSQRRCRRKRRRPPVTRLQARIQSTVATRKFL